MPYYRRALGTKVLCEKTVPNRCLLPLRSPRPRASPCRRSRTAPAQEYGTSPRPQRPLWRRALHYLLMFATACCVVDALVGERGLVATTKARRQAASSRRQLTRCGRRTHVSAIPPNRLESDPSAIESLARESLGLISPGEVLVVVKEVKPSAK